MRATASRLISRRIKKDLSSVHGRARESARDVPSEMKIAGMMAREVDDPNYDVDRFKSVRDG